MDVLNSDLEVSISKNFDFFNRAFSHFDTIRLDMGQVSQKTKSIGEANRKLKYFQLKNMISVYRLQRKKLNIAKVSEILKYMTVLKQSLPVIDNLIQNSDQVSSFDVGLDLIQNATDLIQSKLQGIQVTEQYSQSLKRLKSQCVLKIEEKCSEMVSKHLESIALLG